MKIAKYIFIAMMTLGFGGGVFTLIRGHSRPQALREVCSLVYDRHFYGREVLVDWHRDCMQVASLLPIDSSAEDIMIVAKQQLQRISTSHLEIYSPAEDQYVWSGQQEMDSGIRVRGIDGRFVVSYVYKGSGADRAGVKVGDEILAIQSSELLDPDSIAAASGLIRLSRRNRDIEVLVQPTVLKVDSGPTLKRIAPATALLTISSFRREYFRKEKWHELAQRFNTHEALIVDLRGNLGGDFVAVLRALSPFLCQPTLIGELVRPQENNESGAVIEDGFSSTHIYDLLTSHARLTLKSFRDYPCYEGDVTVLVDQDTASVSEIFAESIVARPGVRVWGEKTRGDMLLGVWYPLPLLGAGYTLSIPEALFRTPNGKVIEGRGVSPQRELYYELSEALRGQDSWVLRALN